MRALLVGCGYVGIRLGRLLAEGGHAVFGVRRSAEAKEELEKNRITFVQADITDTASLGRMPSGMDWVVNLVSSSKGGKAEYEKAYLGGTRNLLERLRGTGLKRFVQVSSTSVYGQTDGSWVDEASPTDPKSATSRLLVQTEELLRREAGELPVVILRAAGIYGLGRGHLFQQFLRGEARLHGNGERLLNMIHVTDLAGFIAAALAQGPGGETFNIADDEPPTEREFLTWVARELGRSLPPSAPVEALMERKRGFTSKRVSNRKAKADLGYRLQYPTYREGYAEDIARARISMR